MSTENKYVPSLDELVFFEGEDAVSNPFDDGLGTDPTDDGTLDDHQSDDTVIDTNPIEDSLEEDKIEDEVSDDSEDDDDSDEGSYTGYFNFLKSNDLLILPEDFEFDGTEEGFQKAVEVTRGNMFNAGAQMVWEQLPKDFQLLLEYGLTGGKDINAVRQVINAQVDLDTLDIEDDLVQEQILEEHLKRTTKYDDARIKKTIDRLRTLGELESEAELAVKDLKGIYNAEREELKENAVREQDEYRQRLQESYNTFTENVKKIPDLNDARKDKIVRSIWTVQKYDKVGEMSYFNYVDTMVKSNPEHLVQLAELYLDYDPKVGFNSESLKRKVKTQVTKDFRNTLEEITKTKLPKGKEGKKITRNTQDGLEQFLQQRRFN